MPFQYVRPLSLHYAMPPKCWNQFYPTTILARWPCHWVPCISHWVHEWTGQFSVFTHFLYPGLSLATATKHSPSHHLVTFSQLPSTRMMPELIAISVCVVRRMHVVGLGFILSFLLIPKLTCMTCSCKFCGRLRTRVGNFFEFSQAAFSISWFSLFYWYKCTFVAFYAHWYMWTSICFY